MIHSLYIDGYKSLEDLTVEFKPGLNTLIGPNGSGKSNIIGALEFVTKLFTTDLVDISKNLGLIKVSELFCLNREKPEIHLVLNGSHRSECRNIKKAQILPIERLEDFISLYTKYMLEFKIEFNRTAKNPFTFTEQKVAIEFCIGGLNQSVLNKLEVEYSKGTFVIKESKLDDLENFISNEVAKLPTLLEANFGTFKTSSIFSMVGSHFYPIRNLIQDTSFGKIFAIYPPVVREDVYKIDTPELQLDGSGLAATLFELKTSNKQAFQGVIEGMKLVSQNVTNISVEYVKSKKKIEVITEIRQNFASDATKQIPLELISDGILKWYALVTAMAVSSEPIIIEEPENYLNPQMQQLFIDYLRDEVDHRENLGIITSHSESLVDVLEPNELILVREKNGRTEASRILEVEKLCDHMRKSEYGLGWYYQSDLLEFYCFDEVS